MAKHYTYILECADGTFYTGYAVDVTKRVQVHNEGKGAKYTRSRIPVRLRYVRTFDSKREAMRFEWQVKQWTREKKQQLMEGTTNEITKELP